MNKIIYDGMVRITKTLDKFYYKNMSINIYCKDDIEYFAGQMASNCRRCIKKTLPVKMLYIRKNIPHEPIDLNIEFNCYKSDKDEIVIDKSKMLSHRLLKISIYFVDFMEAIQIYTDVFNPWLKKFKEPSDGKPLKFTWLVPPDDPTDPNYKKYMKQFLKVCEEDKEFFMQQKLKEQQQ